MNFEEERENLPEIAGSEEEHSGPTFRLKPWDPGKKREHEEVGKK